MICDHSSEVMNAPREAAFERFRRTGFPTKKVERYKYTDIPALMAPDYGLNLQRLSIPVDPFNAFRCDVPNLSTALYFVVNDEFYRGERSSDIRGERREERGGRYADRPLSTAKLPEGVVIGSLRELSTPHSSEHFSLHSPLSSLHSNETTLHSNETTLHSPLSTLLPKYYNRLAGADGDAITDLNTMLCQDGLLVYVPRGVVVDKTIQVINILRSDVDLMVNRRVLIVAEEGAEVKLLFCDHTADDRRFLATQVIEVFAEENARVDLYCMEETHAKNVRLSNVYVSQQRNSRVRHNVITLHNGITRNKLDLTLLGEGAECELGGCVIADKQQHVDNNTLITHQAAHCTSHQLYKYVLDGQATGAFAGRVLVAEGAQKTASQMTNQNLCASREARMLSQPMLEIYADDVRCAHGSTVGQLSDQALFYMRQRGIPEAEARMLLQVAFIREVIDQIELTPLRDRLHYLVDKRFRGELSKCTGCRLCQ